MQYPDEASTFDGRPDPKAFIDWVNEMDHFFDWHKLSDDRKVQFAKLKLIRRAKFFWLNDNNPHHWLDWDDRSLE